MNTGDFMLEGSGVDGYGSLFMPHEPADVFLASLEEMVRQDEKWGSQRQLSDEKWAVILGEEFGEACKEVLEKNPELLIEELVQCHAVITQWIMSIYARNDMA